MIEQLYRHKLNPTHWTSTINPKHSKIIYNLSHLTNCQHKNPQVNPSEQSKTKTKGGKKTKKHTNSPDEDATSDKPTNKPRIAIKF